MSNLTLQPESQSIRLEAPFGDLAVAKGFVTPEQVRECLDDQADLSKKGVQRKLGDLMVERGYMLQHQLDAVLKDQAQAPVEKQIKNYQLLAKLGEGGMGMVLKARRHDDNQLVALKILFKRLAADEQYIKRFRREAEICLTLDHPNLVKCLEVGVSDGLHFMALEFLEGDDLGIHLQRRSFFPEAQALAIVLAAAKGMAYAHKKGLVHRDMKPANIMLTRDGQVKVMDFGLARQLSEPDHKLTLSGVVMGTPHYISPEQVEGRVELDGRSDIYSLGLTFFHMLCGRPPYIGGNLYEIFNAHVTKEVPDPRVFNKTIGPDVASLVLWMCAKEREARPSGMDELIHEIGRILGFPSAASSREPSPLTMLLEMPGPDRKRLQTTQAALHDAIEALRCPRCESPYEGDPLLVTKDQRLRCHSCGLVFPCPITPPTPPPILPDEIVVESVDEAGAQPTFASPSMALMGQQIQLSRPPDESRWKREDPVFIDKDQPIVRPPQPPAWWEFLLSKKNLGRAAWVVLAAGILYAGGWFAHQILSGRFDEWIK